MLPWRNSALMQGWFQGFWGLHVFLIIKRKQLNVALLGSIIFFCLHL